jgi:hypothetical protein
MRTCALLAALALAPSLHSQILDAGQTRPVSFRIFSVPDGVSAMDSHWDPRFTYSAFCLAVPPKGTVKATLDFHRAGHGTLGCYPETRFKSVQKGFVAPWRSLATEAAYTNTGAQEANVYFLVGDPDQVSSEARPYTVTFVRSWAPPTVPSLMR